MKNMKLIGKGSFTKAYLNENNRVILKSCCPIKECMALGWFPDSKLFPELERIDIETYEMEYYPKVKSLKNNLDPGQYEIYKQLRKLYVYCKNKHDYYNAWYKEFQTLENKELAVTMCEALDACTNFGSDIDFEISPRNVAVKDGKLILLDVFYSISKLDEVEKQ